jgi:hypothetical protein
MAKKKLCTINRGRPKRGRHNSTVVKKMEGMTEAGTFLIYGKFPNFDPPYTNIVFCNKNCIFNLLRSLIFPP